jgi:hypothetical protein
MIDQILAYCAQIRRDLKTLQIKDLPWVPVNGWGDLGLPDRTTAVYFLVSRSRGMLYIGRATNLRNRWGQNPYHPDEHGKWGGSDYPAHDQKRPSIELGDVVLHWWVVPRELLAFLESMLLQIHRPPWNSHRG